MCVFEFFQKFFFINDGRKCSIGLIGVNLTLLLIVVINRFLQVMTYSDIVHHKTKIFAFFSHTVRTSYGLKEIMSNKHTVKIQNLFDWCIKTSSKHVVDYDNTHIALNCRVFIVFTIERKLKRLNATFVIVGICVLFYLQLVIAVARDNYGSTNFFQSFDIDA